MTGQNTLLADKKPLSMNFSAGIVLTTISVDYSNILMFNFLHEHSIINAAFHSQFLEEAKISYQNKGINKPYLSAVLLYDDCNFNTAKTGQTLLKYLRNIFLTIQTCLRAPKESVGGQNFSLCTIVIKLISILSLKK